LTLIVIGASAGGLEPLMKIVGALPPDLDAALLVVIHAGSPAMLAQLLTRATALRIVITEGQEPLLPGHLYLAPADQHLLAGGAMAVAGRGPKENRFRPAIDPLFRTAAREFGARVIGVILSGALDDGAHGLSLIKAAGGTAIVQDPAEAFISSMPLAACRST